MQADEGGEGIQEWGSTQPLGVCVCWVVYIAHAAERWGESRLEAAGDLAKPRGDACGDAEWAEDEMEERAWR